MRTRPTRLKGGFTLIELLVVMTIIGLILSFILAAGFQGLRASEAKATASLIAKLDAAVADRMDALLALSPDVTGGHQQLAQIDPSGAMIAGPQRAQVIAQVDMLKAQMIDVFLIDLTNTDYPVNFAGTPALGLGTTSPYPAFALPIGAGSSLPVTPITGMFGASFSARAGIMKGFGTQADGSNVVEPTGYNGADDGGVAGLIDDLAECTLLVPGNAALITNNMKRHTHKTARSEALYAMLTDGSGPLGSYFSADDFTSKEVKDTDGDGCMEFVDAWGEPLQFFRWPIFFGSDPGGSGFTPSFGSDIQKGFYPYDIFTAGNIPETREQNPIDPNQQLMAPAWFSGLPVGTGPTTTPQGPGTNAQQFQALFFGLVDAQTAGAGTNMWDRSNLYSRRAYNSKPLILSSGPGQAPRRGAFHRLATDFGGRNGERRGDRAIRERGGKGGRALLGNPCRFTEPDRVDHPGTRPRRPDQPRDRDRGEPLMRLPHLSRFRAAFTLVELLVVIVIILLVSAVTLPTVLPALQHQQVSEAARILQAELQRSRDLASRTNVPQGIRFPDRPAPGQLKSSRVGI